MESVAGPAEAIDEELLKVPSDVVRPQRVVHEFFALPDVVHRRRAFGLEEFVERVLILAVHFGLAVDVQIRVGLPAVARPDRRDP